VVQGRGATKGFLKTKRGALKKVQNKKGRTLEWEKGPSLGRGAGVKKGRPSVQQWRGGSTKKVLLREKKQKLICRKEIRRSGRN